MIVSGNMSQEIGKYSLGFSPTRAKSGLFSLSVWCYSTGPCPSTNKELTVGPGLP